MLRRITQTNAVRLQRFYTTGRNEGSVAQSQGFNKREKAAEDQYVRQAEEAKLKALRATLEAKKAEVDALEKEHAAVSDKLKKSD